MGSFAYQRWSRILVIFLGVISSQQNGNSERINLSAAHLETQSAPVEGYALAISSASMVVNKLSDVEIDFVLKNNTLVFVDVTDAPIVRARPLITFAGDVEKLCDLIPRGGPTPQLEQGGMNPGETFSASIYMSFYDCGAVASGDLKLRIKFYIGEAADGKQVWAFSNNLPLHVVATK